MRAWWWRQDKKQTAGFQVEMPRCEPDQNGGVGGWETGVRDGLDGGSDAVPGRQAPTHTHIETHTTPGWAGLGGKVTSAVRGSTV